jgi:multidrug transporter EmrE-like cation transporter
MAESFRALVIAMLIVVSAVLFSVVSSRISLGQVYPTCPGLGCVGGYTPCATFAYGDTIVMCYTTPPEKL